jgi:serine/threonine protein kinase
MSKGVVVGTILKGQRGGASFALKRHILADNDAKRRLEREYHALRRLRHPFVIALDAIFIEDSSAYLVLPWMEGGSLDQWIEAVAPSAERLRDVFRCVLHGMAYLHASDVIHRDIKPQNILMDESAVPHISDFDVSKDATFIHATKTQINPGTNGFLAPELDTRPCSAASDVFALGVTMWKCFLPNLPFVVGDKVPTIEGLLPGLRHVLESMLQRDPLKRPSADDFDLFTDKREATAIPSRLEAFRASVALLQAADLTDHFAPCSINASTLIPQVTRLLLEQHGRLVVQFSVHFEGELGVDAGALTRASSSDSCRGAPPLRHSLCQTRR